MAVTIGLGFAPLSEATEEQKDQVTSESWCFSKQCSQEVQKGIVWRRRRGIDDRTHIVHEHNHGEPCNEQCLIGPFELEAEMSDRDKALKAVGAK